MENSVVAQKRPGKCLVLSFDLAVKSKRNNSHVLNYEIIYAVSLLADR